MENNISTVKAVVSGMEFQLIVPLRESPEAPFEHGGTYDAVFYTNVGVSRKQRIQLFKTVAEDKNTEWRARWTEKLPFMYSDSGNWTKELQTRRFSFPINSQLLKDAELVAAAMQKGTTVLNPLSYVGTEEKPISQYWFPLLKFLFKEECIVDYSQREDGIVEVTISVDMKNIFVMECNPALPTKNMFTVTQFKSEVVEQRLTESFHDLSYLCGYPQARYAEYLTVKSQQEETIERNLKNSNSKKGSNNTTPTVVKIDISDLY